METRRELAQQRVKEPGDLYARLVSGEPITTRDTDTAEARAQEAKLRALKKSLAVEYFLN